MMIEPPIDKLIRKATCRYALCCGLAKRAKELAAVNSPELEKSHMKSISYAANEIFTDKIIIRID